MFAIDGILNAVSTVIDKIFPDANVAANAKLEMMKLAQAGEFKELESRYAAINTEGASTDPWTSRARPTFLFVFYFILLLLIIVAPFTGIFFPAQMAQFFVNVQAGFKAIPDSLYTLFGAGYLGYTTARTIEKKAGVQ
jgi:hypothetical protein